MQGGGRPGAEWADGLALFSRLAHCGGQSQTLTTKSLVQAQPGDGLEWLLCSGSGEPGCSPHTAAEGSLKGAPRLRGSIWAPAAARAGEKGPNAKPIERLSLGLNGASEGGREVGRPAWPSSEFTPEPMLDSAVRVLALPRPPSLSQPPWALQLPGAQLPPWHPTSTPEPRKKQATKKTTWQLALSGC